MSRRTPTDAMLEDIHTRVKVLDRQPPFIHMVEEAMTVVHVPRERQSDLRRNSDYYAYEHEPMLRRLQRIFTPLIGKRLTISGQLGLMLGDTWCEYMADYAPHGVKGILECVEGFVLERVGSFWSSTQRGVQSYQYCLKIVGPDLDIHPDDPGIDLGKHELSNGVIIPVLGLGSGWWQQIVRVEEVNR